MHTFLMVLLWVVLGLLALLAVLLIVPAAVAVEYKQGEFTARRKRRTGKKRKRRRGRKVPRRSSRLSRSRSFI